MLRVALPKGFSEVVDMFPLSHKFPISSFQEGCSGLEPGLWQPTQCSAVKRGVLFPFLPFQLTCRESTEHSAALFPCPTFQTALGPRKAQKPHPVLFSKTWSVHFLTRDIKACRITCNPSGTTQTGLSSLSETAAIILFPCCPKSFPFHHSLERC